MSSYLTFRKNEVEIGSYSRNTKIYEALENMVPFSKWETTSIEKLNLGIKYLKEEIENDNKKAKALMEMLPYTKTMDDVREIYSEIDMYKEDITQCREAIEQIKVYKIIFYPYGNNDKFEWTLD